MANLSNRLPSCILIVGVDGSGKTTITNWLAGELAECGVESEVVWSRFMNYLSKPLLALTRLTGHNYYRTIDGVRFGYHDFESLPVYRELFAVLQAVDVNIAAWNRIRSKCNKGKLVICERGPWDTLVDVVSDTGLDWLFESWLGRVYTRSLPEDALTIHISRSRENILGVRSELVHDGKVGRRIDLYDRLGGLNGWQVVDNNGTLEDTKQSIRCLLGMNGQD